MTTKKRRIKSNGMKIAMCYNELLQVAHCQKFFNFSTFYVEAFLMFELLK